MDRLIDYFPNWTTAGVFARLSDWTPWADNADVNPHALDMLYLGNRSGWRAPSPYLLKILPPYHVISDEQFAAIDEMLKVLYAEKWGRIYAAMSLEYNVGDNVNLTEHTISDGTRDTDEDGTAATDIKNDSTNSNYVVPFGAANGTYAETTKQAVDGETSSSAATNKTTRNANEAHEDEVTKTTTGKTAGTSYAEEVQREIDLRRNTFFEIVFSDVDEILTSPYWI